MFWKRHAKLAVALTCADWRLHHPRVNLNGQLARALGVNGVDVLAVPGPDGLLAPQRETEWRAAVAQASLLIGAHSPRTVAIVAHQRCAGHPVSDPQHDVDVAAAAKALKEATGFAGPVAALVAVYRNDARWLLNKIGTY
jgi:hypothetical protein